ncbi:hypothetical protein EAI99_13755 [Alistipes onderdonkii]|nr:hypothetical protein [Alistipes onderdonkii]MBD9238349.1 hypothetical protein [Alistipes onderdonkii]RYT99972.1 hypothetical protein EAI99_13755 [Alistipes onderdonkii]
MRGVGKGVRPFKEGVTTPNRKSLGSKNRAPGKSR